jgi:hypothetical protein
VRQFLFIFFLFPFFCYAQENGAQRIGSYMEDSFYYNGTERFHHGIKNFPDFPELASKAKAMGDYHLSDEIALDYIRNYLDKKNGNAGISRENIIFLNTYLDLVTPADPVFSWFYSYPSQIDSVTRKGFAPDVVDFIIVNKEVPPLIKLFEQTEGSPDWIRIQAQLMAKYSDEIVSRSILNSKIKYYTNKQDYLKIAKYTFERNDRYGIDTVGFKAKYLLNGMIWDIVFLHVSDPELLEKAIHELEPLVTGLPKPYPFIVDTYANLLYKAGHRGQAQRYELQAAQGEAELAVDEHRAPDPVYRTTYEKMRKGIPTWKGEN